MAISSTPSFGKTQSTDAPKKSLGETTDVEPGKKRQGFPRWILFASLGILIAAGAIGGLLFLRQSAKIHSGKAVFASSASVDAKATKPAPTVATTDLPLEPFVVNLADAGGHSYARIGLTLQLVTPAAANAKNEKKDAGANDASGPRDMVRDTIITVLNQEQSTDLLAPGGKERLKNAIRAAVVARDPQIKIADIYFTEFLIQQ